MATPTSNTQHITIRVVADDFDTWLREHTNHAEMRKTYGIRDGPVYRDVVNPNAAFAHLMTEDLAKAMEWFKSPAFREGTARARVVGREFYVAERR